MSTHRIEDRAFEAKPRRRDGLGLVGARVTYAALFAAATAAYYLLWRGAPVLTNDSAEYMELAQDLSDLSLDRLHYRTPGYPLLLLLAGSAWQPTRALFLASLILHFASVLLLAAVVRRAGLPRRAVCVFCLLLALPPFVEPAVYVLTESLTELTLTLGVFSLVRWWSSRGPAWLAAAAVSVAYAAITRPTFQALALALACCLLAMPLLFGSGALAPRGALKAGAALVAASVVLLSAISMMNYTAHGYFGTSSMMGITLSIKTVSFAERLPDEDALLRDALVAARDAELVKPGSSHTGASAIWVVDRAELAARLGMSETHFMKYLTEANLRLIRRAPLQYLAAVASSVGMYWFPRGSSYANMGSRSLQFLWAAGYLVLFGLFFVQLTVIAGILLYGASRRWIAREAEPAAGPLRMTPLQAFVYLSAGTIVFYTMVVSCVLSIGEPRFRAPTEGLIVAMVFLGFHVWWRSLSPARAEQGAGSEG